jgi:hypothetical protein
MKNRACSHLGYSNTSTFGGCRHIAEITRKLDCIAKILRQVVPVKYWQHPKAGSKLSRGLPRRLESTRTYSRAPVSVTRGPNKRKIVEING